VAPIDKHRLSELIDAHGAALALYARQWCTAPDDALQESLIELLRHEPVPDHPLGWLYKTVRRRALNLARAERRRRKHHGQASADSEPWFLPQESELDEPIDCQQLLVQLPQLEREIVVARLWGELSFSQIAELVGRSSSSVHRRYQRALAFLHESLDQQTRTKRPNNASGPVITE
jgi:RNA polymerase sigma factor (sigma-70 family)